MLEVSVVWCVWGLLLSVVYLVFVHSVLEAICRWQRVSSTQAPAKTEGGKDVCVCGEGVSAFVSLEKTYD